MIEIANLQNSIKVDSDILLVFAQKAQELIPESHDQNISIALIDDKRMVELNSLFRKKDGTTDVLSFRNEPDDFEDKNELGDIVISIDQAEKQANENDLPLDTELKQLILHGILHLCGYDHETDDGEMNTLELQLRDKLDVNQ